MKYCEAVVAHYESCWFKQGEVCAWHDGPRQEISRDFSVLQFPPSDDRTMWTYATACMSRESDEERIEIHLFSPRKADEQIELLTAIAHYHRTGSRLNLGHTVNFGRPWLPDSECTHGLLSLPYLDGPDLERLKIDGGTVRFLWLIPVTQQEVEFKKQYGLEKLEARFEEVGFDYLDPLRKSVVFDEP